MLCSFQKQANRGPSGWQSSSYHCTRRPQNSLDRLRALLYCSSAIVEGKCQYRFRKRRKVRPLRQSRSPLHPAASAGSCLSWIVVLQAFGLSRLSMPSTSMCNVDDPKRNPFVQSTWHERNLEQATKNRRMHTQSMSRLSKMPTLTANHRTKVVCPDVLRRHELCR